MNRLGPVAFTFPESEILYRLGQPTHVTQKDTMSGKLLQTERTAHLPRGKSIDDYGQWEWLIYDPELGIDLEYGLSVEFQMSSDGKRTIERLSCYTRPWSTIGGLSVGSGEWEVVTRLGQPDSISYSDDKNVKYLDYDVYGLQLALTSGQVAAIHRWKVPIPSFSWWLFNGPDNR